MTRPAFRDRSNFERSISEEVFDLIVRRYAQNGRVCETAKLIFLGPENPTPEQRKFGGKPPGKFPKWLVDEMRAARAEYVANPPVFEHAEVA